MAQDLPRVTELGTARPPAPLGTFPKRVVTDALMVHRGTPVVALTPSNQADRCGAGSGQGPQGLRVTSRAGCIALMHALSSGLTPRPALPLSFTCCPASWAWAAAPARGHGLCQALWPLVGAGLSWPRHVFLWDSVLASILAAPWAWPLEWGLQPDKSGATALWSGCSPAVLTCALGPALSGQHTPSRLQLAVMPSCRLPACPPCGAGQGKKGWECGQGPCQ